jgi:poly-gamma-glutamate capsule biosynthesis protein CapA/YwtB (metallophosphatase superfamily)
MSRIPIETYGDRVSRRQMRKQRTRARVLLVLVAVAAAAAVVYAIARAVPADVLGGASEPRPATSVETTSAPEMPKAQPISGQGEPSPAATAPQPATPSLPPTITIAAVGDLMFDRQVKEMISAKGGAEPLEEVAERLSKADVAIGNLESMLSSRGTRNTDKDVTFRGHPAAIEALRIAGFDALSLANNHTMDYGPEPVADTIAALGKAGIGYAGAGPNRTAAWKPATIERSGAKVAYLAYTHILPAGFLVGENSWGVASGKMDMSLITEAVRAAKKTHDYVIVSFHWGVEYEDYANGDQVKKAHQVIDAGADMVLAHHPHVIQGVEYYKGRLIAYSLGDFVFDHYSRKTGEAFILEAELGPNGVDNAVAVPVYLYRVGKPKYVSGKEARVILKRLQEISAPHGTSVVLEGDEARILRK